MAVPGAGQSIDSTATAISPREFVALMSKIDSIVAHAE
jgi:hypothetical protein